VEERANYSLEAVKINVPNAQPAAKARKCGWRCDEKRNYAIK